MSKIAFIFPGQASQYSGMGREIRRQPSRGGGRLPAGRRGARVPLSAMCFQGSEDELKLTENTQPAILTVSVAVLQVLRSAACARLRRRAQPGRDLSGRRRRPDVRRRGPGCPQARPLHAGSRAGGRRGDGGSALHGPRDRRSRLRRGPRRPGAGAGQHQLSGADRRGRPRRARGPGHQVRQEAGPGPDDPARERAVPLRLMRPAQEQMAQDLSRIAFGDLAVPLVTSRWTPGSSPRVRTPGTAWSAR